MELTHDRRQPGSLLQSGPLRLHGWLPRGLLPALVILLLGAPILIVLIAGLVDGGGPAWQHVVSTRLVGDTLRTVALLALSSVLLLLLAVPAAWLVTLYRFPGRALLEWMLILPLAAPGYVIAYAYKDLLDVAGPVQAAIRDATGLGARDYWFPDIASLPGVALVLSLALYPYVYLAARAAFTTQSVCTLEAARTLGAGPGRRFWSVALPAARPAIVAGLALALMEIAADFGAASFLGVQTLTVSLFSIWKAFGDAGVAARMALVLLALVFLLQWIERRHRGRGGVQATSLRWRSLARQPLSGAAAIAAPLVLVLLFALAFVIPMGRLVWLAIEHRDAVAPLGDALRNTVVLAVLGSALAFACAVIIALAARAHTRLGTIGRAIASSGYAVPGPVLALGALAMIGWMTQAGWIIGPTVPIGIAALLIVYASRFTASASSAIEAGLARAPDSLRHAASALGSTPMRRAFRLDLPLAASSAFAGALILFVEILKELPATLMLRPFDWDTLAVRAHGYASDERLAAAALPSLLITAAGLVPVILLSRRLSGARPGAGGGG